MIDSVEGARRRFAEELRTTHRLGSEALVEALARVPRERFLGPGPWLVRGERDREPRTPADPHEPGPTSWLHGSSWLAIA